MYVQGYVYAYNKRGMYGLSAEVLTIFPTFDSMYHLLLIQCTNYIHLLLRPSLHCAHYQVYAGLRSPLAKVICTNKTQRPTKYRDIDQIKSMVRAVIGPFVLSVLAITRNAIDGSTTVITTAVQD